MKFRGFLCATILCLFCFVDSAHATHFRFAHHTWKRISNNVDGSVTVEFEVLEAWRENSVDILSLSFGDGQSYTPAPASITDVVTLNDIANEQYRIRKYTVQHSYSAADIATNLGVFVVNGSSCCRISSLQNAGDDSESINLTVDLNGGNIGSPKTSIPVILQVPVGQTFSLLLPAADPDRDPITCRLATAAESSIGSLASFNSQDLAVSTNCLLSWNLTSATAADVGKKYAVQVMFEESNRCSATPPVGSVTQPSTLTGPFCASTPVDFIVEFVEGNPPSCAIDRPSNSTAYSGFEFRATFTGTDTDPGDVLTLQALGLPTGSTLTPAAATSQGSPFATVFSWTPTVADRNSANAITVTFRDSKGLENSCLLSLQVPAGGPPVDHTCKTTDQTKRLLALDGTASQQRAVITSALKSLARRGLSSAQQQKFTSAANAAYLQAWTAAWALPNTFTQCTNASSCTSTVFTSTTASYSAGTVQLKRILDALTTLANRYKDTRLATAIARNNKALFTRAATDVKNVAASTVDCSQAM